MKQLNKQKTQNYIFAYSILIPIMALFTIIRFYPIISTFITSFYKKSMIRPGQTFIGLENYIYVLKDPEFLKAFGNTAFIAFFSVVLSVIFGLFLAVKVNGKSIKGMSIFQTLLFLPVIVSMVPATLMWQLLFDFNVGAINYILKAMSLKPVNWINDIRIVRWPIIIISVWKEMGYNMMIFYVGLKAINKELYESADMDGANGWQKFRYITVPQLKPVTLFVSVISIIKFVKVFTQAIVLTSGSQSAGNILKTAVYYIYQQGFALHSMGRASAASIILLVIVLVLTWLQMMISKEKD
ncbi:MAG: sugar ABC transporter permease [Sphaerochaetaceae bacterium]|nr:sugar ABC transporter permease [Sphaerochaetaceae bacterium]